MRTRAARLLAVSQALLLLLTLVAPALAAAAEITTDLWIYRTGDTVNVTGVDFGPDEDVVIVTTDPYGAETDRGVAHTDETGRFTYSFVLASEVPGIYDVVASGATSDLSAATQFDPNCVGITATAFVWKTGTFNLTINGDFKTNGGCSQPANIAVSLRTRDGTNNDATGTPVAGPTNASLDPGAKTWTITFTGLSPADAKYDLLAQGSGSPAADYKAVIDDYLGVDTTRPSTTIAAPVLAASDITASGTISDATSGPASVAASLYAGACPGTTLIDSDVDTTVSGGAWSVNNLAGGGNNDPGTYCIRSAATDVAGNVESPVTTREYTVDTRPSVVSTSIAEGATGVAVGSNISFTFSENVTVDTSPSWITLQCGATAHSGATTGSGTTTITFDPSTNLAGNTSCTATLGQNRVHDVDANDPPDDLAANFVLHFTTASTDSTAPVINKVITGTAGSGGWYRSNVTVAWTVNDPESAVVIDSGCGTQNFTSETAAAVSSCTAHSAGGSSSDSVSIKIDKTAPVIGATASTSAGSYTADTWTNLAVSVSFSCADTGSVQSGIATDTVASDNDTLSSETPGTTITSDGACVDAAGNSDASGSFGPIKIDKTGPVITATALKSDNTAYVADTWTTLSVAVTFACSDGNGSGLASNTVGGGGTEDGDTASGSFTNTGACTDNAGNSALPMTFSPIKVDKTAPVITATALKADLTAYAADTWTNQSVTVSFSCADALSLLASNTVGGGGTEDGDTASGSFTNTGACTDNAGNSALPMTFSPIKVDKTAPVITATALKADLTAYAADTWTNQSVTVSFSCADALSLLASNTVGGGGTEDGDTASGSFTNTGACTDNAGNSALPMTFSPIKVDKTAPVITATALKADLTAYAADTWTNQSVTVSFSCADALSLLASNTVGGGGTEDGDTASGSFTNTGACTDNAGNSALPMTFSPIKVDKTAPVVTLAAGGVQDGGVYYYSFVPAGPTTCSANGAISGLTAAGCTVSGYSAAIGTHTVTGIATDLAGNTGTDSRTYEVRAWTLSGFYSPVDMGGFVNTVKGGSTVPLKFEIFAGSTELKDVSYVRGFKATETNCLALNFMPADDIEITSTGGTQLRYDSTGGQFIQNWQTPKNKIGSCWAVTMTTDDGTSINAYFKLK